jgi:hypothetical protein
VTKLIEGEAEHAPSPLPQEPQQSSHKSNSKSGLERSDKKWMVRKGGLEPPRLTAPDPKFAGNEESMTYKTCEQHPRNATSDDVACTWLLRNRKPSQPFGVAGGHNLGHKADPSRHKVPNPTKAYPSH